MYMTYKQTILGPEMTYTFLVPYKPLFYQIEYLTSLSFYPVMY